MKTPKVSFCIISYNQEEYIEDALRSAFAQDYNNLEIVISDDHSSDRTVEKIKEMVASYTGTHEIRTNFNTENVGIRENCNKVLYELAKGDIILLAGGDDVSDPKRTSRYVDVFDRFPEVVSVSCKSRETDANLNPLSVDEEYDKSFSVFTLHDYLSFSDFVNLSGDSRGLRRIVIDSFPPLKYSTDEDINFFIRGLMLGSACYLREPLVSRRNHDHNTSHIRLRKYDAFTKQANVDINYALEKKYITEDKAVLLIKKVSLIREIFEIYWNPPFSSAKTLFYRAINKLFKAKKNR